VDFTQDMPRFYRHFGSDSTIGKTVCRQDMVMQGELAP